MDSFNFILNAMISFTKVRKEFVLVLQLHIQIIKTVSNIN